MDYVAWSDKRSITTRDVRRPRRLGRRVLICAAGSVLSRGCVEVGEETGWSGVAVCLDRDNNTTGQERLTACEPRNRVLPCRPTRYASWLLAPQNARSLSSFAPPGCLSRSNSTQSSGTAASERAASWIMRGHEWSLRFTTHCRLQQADLDSYSRLAIRMSQTEYDSAIPGALSISELAAISR
jgi:hypothetical protein